MDATTLSLLVSLAIALVRWGFTELQKPSSPRRKALAVGAMALGAGFFVWMVFFRTADTIAGTAVYVVGRRLFRSCH